jgi:DNA-binding HxlR family transcriptional regulator
MDTSKDPAAAASFSTRVRSGDVLASSCRSRDVLAHLTSFWGVLVMLALEGQRLRFSALRQTIAGVSERMLAQTLDRLEGDGLVNRIAYDVVPPHVEYELTTLGIEAAEKLRALADWIEFNLPRIQQVWQDRARVGGDVLQSGDRS